ncbi:hypothetical protein chiPu_0004339 [Chiloscyllium punctatum]|uniref:Uncharacterized protein n=1 Tax=Chiloscyllium punctatum TaxID=137246 RepID=A0A401S6A0_CHIPU|nr:hypothetical protein [Chiloscyllium punctatum]
MAGILGNLLTYFSDWFCFWIAAVLSLKLPSNREADSSAVSSNRAIDFDGKDASTGICSHSQIRQSHWVEGWWERWGGSGQILHSANVTLVLEEGGELGSGALFLELPIQSVLDMTFDKRAYTFEPNDGYSHAERSDHSITSDAMLELRYVLIVLYTECGTGRNDCESGVFEQ